MIRLNLGNDYCLVIDPLATPKIEKCEEPPKPKGKPIIKLEDVEDISQIDIQTKDNILLVLISKIYLHTATGSSSHYI